MVDRLECNMRPKYEMINKVARFSLGVNQDSGQHYISIPVANRLVDYDECYELSPAEYQLCLNDEANAALFAKRYKARKFDARLMIQPGTDRGISS